MVGPPHRTYLFECSNFSKSKLNNWHRNPQEHFPLTFNKDLIKKCKGIGPVSSMSIFHRFLIRIE